MEYSKLKEQEQFEKWSAKNGLQQEENRTNVGQTRCENFWVGCHPS